MVIAIVGFGIAYFIKTAFLTPKQTNPSSLQIAPTLTPVPTPIGWKSYTNTAYTLTFSYPPSDSIKTTTYGFGVTNVELQNTKNNTSDFQLLFLPTSIAQMVGQNFDTYYSMPDNTTKVIKNPLAKDSRTEKFTKLHNRSIDGNQALDYTAVASNAKAGTKAEIGTFIEKGTTLILISTNADNKTRLEQLLTTLH